MKRTEKMIRRYYLLVGIIGLLGCAYFLGHHAGAVGQQLSCARSTAANMTIGWLFREKRDTDDHDHDHDHDHHHDNVDTCSCWYKMAFFVPLIGWFISVAGMMICFHGNHEPMKVDNPLDSPMEVDNDSDDKC